MKLYNYDASPFAARVRLFLRAKGAEIELIKPPAPAEYRQITPMGKVPALLLDDGSILPESEVICGYLDGVLPGASLWPADPAERARVNLIVRLVDLYVAPALHDFFVLLFTAPDNHAAVAALAPPLARGLKYLDAYIAGNGCAAGAGITQADCALAPALLYVAEVMPLALGQDLLEKRPALAAYWQRIREHETAKPVLEEIRANIKKSYAAAIGKMRPQ